MWKEGKSRRVNVYTCWMKHKLGLNNKCVSKLLVCTWIVYTDVDGNPQCCGFSLSSFPLCCLLHSFSPSLFLFFPLFIYIILQLFSQCNVLESKSLIWGLVCVCVCVQDFFFLKYDLNLPLSQHSSAYLYAFLCAFYCCCFVPWYWLDVLLWHEQGDVQLWAAVKSDYTCSSLFLQLNKCPLF